MYCEYLINNEIVRLFLITFKLVLNIERFSYSGISKRNFPICKIVRKKKKFI